MRREQEEDRAQAGQGPARADRRGVQGAVQAGVRGPARPGACSSSSRTSGSTGEAKQQNVKVSDAEVKKQFEQQKKQSFPKEEDYQKFLKTSGITEEDVLFRVRLEQLSNKLREKITKGKDKVTDAQIKAYYNKNKKRFAQPERRDLRVVLTKDKAKADAAKKALEGGDSPGSRSPRSTRSTRPPRTRAASCSPSPRASRSRRSTRPSSAPTRASSTGPVKTQFGYYVFEVRRSRRPASRRSSRPRRRSRASSRPRTSRRRSTSSSRTSRRSGRRRRTAARATSTQDCKNAPKPKTRRPRTGAQPAAAAGQPQQPAAAAAEPQPARLSRAQP